MPTAIVTSGRCTAAATETSLYVAMAQEVIGGAGEAIDPQEYASNGLVTEFGFTTELYNHFQGHGQLQYLQTMGTAWGLLAGTDALVCVDNHDRQRSDPASTLTYKDGPLHTLASVFMLGFPYGHPRVMSSFYFDDVNQGPPDTAVHKAGADMKLRASLIRQNHALSSQNGVYCRPAV